LIKFEYIFDYLPETHLRL